MFGAGQALSLPAGLLGSGIILIAVTSGMVLVLYMQRRATRQWGNTNPQDQSYKATYRRTFYRAYRLNFYKYAVGLSYLLGIGLVVASGIAKWVG